MSDSLHAILRSLHMTGALLAFAGAPLALLAVKGSRRHVVAGRAFVGGMALLVPMGLTVDPPDLGAILTGIQLLFFVGTGFLAPRVARGSRSGRRWDRGLTAVGMLASVGQLVVLAARFEPRARMLEYLVDGTLGLAVAGLHWRWRGASEPARWRTEHLTSLLAAYTIAWLFICVLYGEPVHLGIRLLAPGLLGGAGIAWARRRFSPQPLGTTAGAWPSPG
jgi:hypothetical protein